jgi:hypothetical protein
MKSIADKAEVSIDFPDKTYIGSFGRESAFDLKVGPDEILLRIVRTGGERRQFALHLHYYLLADILTELSRALAEHDPLDRPHLETLRIAATELVAALKARRAPAAPRRNSK